ncbi:MAG: hypothetical protein OQK12_12315 [Motiliproteus sp.]|nr:hypothetical protein [Motiliproteus sp.]MCW9051934.1 hypothetical protein [Motiliproteus sp.]
MTRTLHCISGLIALIILWLPGSVVAQEESAVALVDLPPQSLAQWYKPQNKRQVWLHTMFRLRQSMQAVDYYLDANDDASLKRWSKILLDTYAKLPKMVPEWENATRQGVAKSLHQAAMDGDHQGVAKQRKRLQKFCDGCHLEWQPLVSAYYRSPDYRKVEVETKRHGVVDYPAMMQQLSATLGVLKITREDGDMPKARQAAKQLQSELDELGSSCQQCHRSESSYEQVLGKEIQQEFDRLQTALVAPHDPKKSGRPLGMIGFKVCGRCHSLHRTLGDLRNWVSE